MTTINLACEASNRHRYYWTGSAWAKATDNNQVIAGWRSATLLKNGGFWTFASATVPRGAAISSATVDIVSGADKTGTIVNTVLKGQAIDDAENVDGATIEWATYIAWARTLNSVVWDGIAAWTVSVTYTTPDIKSIIQEIVNRPGWVSGNRIRIFWEDHDGRSTAGADCERRDSGGVSETLNITYTGGGIPTVSTQMLTDITSTTATGNGSIINNGGASVTQHGHCWSLSINPTTSDFVTQNGAGSNGAFTSALTNLILGTRYYVRAYATNANGTGYGDNVVFIAGHRPSMMIKGNLAVVNNEIRYFDAYGVQRSLTGTEV